MEQTEVIWKNENPNERGEKMGIEEFIMCVAVVLTMIVIQYIDYRSYKRV